MIERLFDLTGPQAWLAWVSLFNVIVGFTGILVRAIPPSTPPRLAPYLCFMLGFVIIYCRGFYRQVYHTPLTAWSAATGALVGLSMVWLLVTSLIDKRAVMRRDVEQRYEQRKLIFRQRPGDWK